MRDRDAALVETAVSAGSAGALDETRVSEVAAPSVADEPRRIGRFAVLRRLGAGGMGQVFAGYDEALDRRVALKLLKVEGSDGRARLRREAQAMARVAHPNVVPIFEVGEHEGRVFLAMEFVDGVTLGAWRAAAPRSWQEVARLYLQAARGLQAAHAAAIVHRDFKPDNVLVSSDVDGPRARVLDFGLAAVPGSAGTGARAEADDAEAMNLTVTGTILGTPAYMSPEQHRGEPADVRSDVFSFCVALHEALHGVRPFQGSTRGEVLAAIDAGEVTSGAGARAIPSEIERLTRRGLARDPAARWPSMDPIVAGLAAILEAGAGEGLDRRQGRRLRRIAGVVGVVVSAAILALGAEGAGRASTAAQVRLDAAVVVVVGIGAAIGRAGLASRYNRRLLGLVATLALGLLANSLVIDGVGGPALALVLVDAAMIGAVFGLGAVLVERWLGLAIVAAGLGALGESMWPARAFLVHDLLMASICGLVLWRWWWGDGVGEAG